MCFKRISTSSFIPIARAGCYKIRINPKFSLHWCPIIRLQKEKSNTPDTDYLQISAESYQNYQKTIYCPIKGLEDNTEKVE